MSWHVLDDAPLTWEHVRLGWVEILDGVKTLLETGQPMPPVETSEGAPAAEDIEGTRHCTQAIAANNAVWELLDAESPAVSERLTRAGAASYHWARAAKDSARASWLLARCHAACGSANWRCTMPTRRGRNQNSIS